MVKTKHFCSCHGDTTALAVGDVPQSAVTAFVFFAAKHLIVKHLDFKSYLHIRTR